MNMINFEDEEVSELESLLAMKKQIIIEGPPGAGKTFVADKLARYFTGNHLEGEHDKHVLLVNSTNRTGTKILCKEFDRKRMRLGNWSTALKTAFSSVFVLWHKLTPLGNTWR